MYPVPLLQRAMDPIQSQLQGTPSANEHNDVASGDSRYDASSDSGDERSSQCSPADTKNDFLKIIRAELKDLSGNEACVLLSSDTVAFRTDWAKKHRYDMGGKQAFIIIKNGEAKECLMRIQPHRRNSTVYSNIFQMS